MKKEKIIGIAVGVLVIAGGSFYFGMKYEGSTAGRAGAANARGAFANLTPEERQARLGQAGGTLGARGSRVTDGGFASGEVISKDDKSVTLKLSSGGSKIVFLSDKAIVTKSISGLLADVTVGQQVTITGTANSDGSLTGQTVQIRPSRQEE